MASPVRTCSADTTSPRRAATSATSGPPPREAKEFHCRIRASGWVDLRAEGSRTPQNLVVRLEALQHDGRGLRVELFVPAGRASEVPRVDEDIRQSGDEGHLDRYFASPTRHRLLEDSRLAQDGHRALPDRLPRRLRGSAVAHGHAEPFGDLALNFDHVVDELTHVPIGAGSGILPLVVGDGPEAVGEAVGSILVPVDDVHVPIIAKPPPPRSGRPAAGQEPSGNLNLATRGGAVW